jgi:hypothetical protein
MLKFNPDERSTIDEMLQDQMFDSIRVPLMEKDAPSQIEISIDRLPVNTVTGELQDYSAKKIK